MPRKNHTPPHQPFIPSQTCGHKRRFVSEAAALEAAEYQMLVKPQLELHVYLCAECHGWHLTRQTRPQS